MKKKINRLLVLTHQPLNKYYVERFGLNHLNKSRAKVTFLNLLFLVNRDVANNYLKKNVVKYSQNYKNIKSYKSLFDEINKFNGDFFYINILGSFHLINLILTIYLRLKGGKSIVIQNTFIPQKEETINNKLLRLIKKNNLIKSIIFLITKKTISNVSQFLSSKPFYVFVGNQHLFDLNLKKYLKKVQKVSSHDYFNYHQVRNKKKLTGLGKKKYVLFIDQEQDLTFDHRMNFSKEAYIKSNYWERMEDFFRFLEKKTGMEVIIAGHYRRTNVKILKNRRVYFDKTPLLVHYSSIVLTHDSNALNLAVLSKKPIIFLTLDEFKNRSGKSEGIEKISKLLKNIVVNIDENYKKYFKNNYKKVSIKDYESYEKKYITFKNKIKVESMWITILNKLENTI